MILLVIACCFFPLGVPVPAHERGPILRKPDVVLVTPPVITYRPATLDLACLAAIHGTGTQPSLAALAGLVELGHAKGGDCAIAVDFTVEMHASNRFSLDTHAYWRLAGEAATTRERRIAAFRIAALYAWHEAYAFVHSAIRGGAAFPLEPWLVAGDAFTRAADDDPRLAPYAIDAYENALRASRERALTPAQAAHIAEVLALLPGDRAAALRLRIRPPD